MSTVARTLTLFNNFSVTYPNEPSVLLSYTGGWQAELRLPPWLLKTAFCVGSFWLASMATRFLFRSMAWAYRSLKTRFNIAKVLNDAPDPSLGAPKAFVVIYGAANQIGSAFARYFALRGYNLLLIDEQEDKLVTLETEIYNILDARYFYQPNGGNPQAASQAGGAKPERVKIRRIAIEFEKGEIADKKLEFKLRSIIENHEWAAFLIDCKNLKIKDGGDFHIYECPLISKIASYNARGSALLLKIVLRNMLHFKCGGLISVLNTNEKQGDMKNKHALYLATTDFKSSLFSSLSAAYSDTPLQFLTLHNNPKRMRSEKQRDGIVEMALRNLGVRGEVHY